MRQAAGAGADDDHQHMVAQMKQCIKRIEAVIPAVEAMDKANVAGKEGTETKKTQKSGATAAGGNAFAALAGSDEEDAMDLG